MRYADEHDCRKAAIEDAMIADAQDGLCCCLTPVRMMTPAGPVCDRCSLAIDETKGQAK